MKKTTFWRGIWILAPLLMVAWQAAPEWPARTAMLESPWREFWYPVAKTWAGVHPVIATSESESPNLIAPSVTAPVDTRPAMASTVVDSLVVPPHSKSTSLPADPSTSQVDPSISSRVLLLGDSLMGEVASGFRQELPKNIIVIDRHKSSTGLTNKDYYDWPKVATESTKVSNPTDVVIHLGGNDAQDMNIQGRWVHFASEEWVQTYKARADLMVSNIRKMAPNAHLVWVGLPVVRSPTFNAKIRKLEAIQKSMANSENIPYISSQDVLGDTYKKDGLDDKGHRQILRADDGVHYSRMGGILIAKEVCNASMNRWPCKD